MNASLQTAFIINSTKIPSRRSWYFTPVDEIGITLTASIIFPLMVFGVFGNILTIFVIQTSPKLRSLFFTLIVSLCFSDLFSALLSVLYLYRRTWGIDNWTLPEFFCKFSTGADIATSIATSLHILVFSAFRLFSLKWPYKFKVVSLTHTRICIAIIWLVALGCGFVPLSIMNEVKPIEIAWYRLRYDDSKTWHICSLGKRWYKKYRQYTFVIYIAFFHIPLILVCLTSVGIALVFCKRRIKKSIDLSEGKIKTVNQNTLEASRQKKENQAILQLVLIIGSFMLGYLPESAYHIYISLRGRPTRNNLVFGWWFSMIAYILLRLSECLNPLLYNFGSSKIRHETMRYLGCCSICKRSGPSNGQFRLADIATSSSTKKHTV